MTCEACRIAATSGADKIGEVLHTCCIAKRHGGCEACVLEERFEGSTFIVPLHTCTGSNLELSIRASEFLRKKRDMVACDGCGFSVEVEDVRSLDVDELWYRDDDQKRHCLTCRKCTECPDMRESYRRGFNDGLDALKEAVIHTVEKSNLRRRS